MFLKEDQGALEAANRVVLNRIRGLQADWIKAISSRPGEAFRIDAVIWKETEKNNVLTKIMDGFYVSQAELTLLLEDADLIGYRKSIVRCAKVKPIAIPEIPGVALCIVTSTEQLSTILKKPAPAKAAGGAGLSSP